MRGPTILLIPLAALTGCLFPTHYPHAPRYDYFPGSHSSTCMHVEPTEPVVVAEPQPAAPAAPAAPAVASGLPVADETMLKLQRERDAAQKALDDYTVEYCRRSMAREARAPRATPPGRLSAPASTSVGLALGVRALDEPIDDSSIMATFGLGISHRFAGSCAALDLGLGYAGFAETGASADRYFSTFETTAGLRLVLSSIDGDRPNDSTTFYVGGGVMSVDVEDSFETFTGETISEESDSATGTYACIGVNFGGSGTGRGDLELRQVSGTSFSTYGQERSSDGVELLLRLSATF